MVRVGSGWRHTVGTGHHHRRGVIRKPAHAANAAAAAVWIGGLVVLKKLLARRRTADGGRQTYRTSRIHHRSWRCRHEGGHRGWSSIANEHRGGSSSHRTGRQLVHRGCGALWLARQRQVVDVDVQTAYVTPRSTRVAAADRTPVLLLLLLLLLNANKT